MSTLPSSLEGCPSPLSASQWLSLSEDSLFLHDGLIRVTDLVELPHDVQKATGQGGKGCELGDLGDELEEMLLSLDSQTPEELCNRIATLCRRQSNEYARLLEYRLNALHGLWKAQALWGRQNSDSTLPDESRKALGLPPGEQINFSSRVSLLLVFPLLQSQAQRDPELRGVATALLVQCLRDCAPLSLSREPPDCLQGLEGLLCSWIDAGASQVDEVASALVVLACARGTVPTFVRTVHLLQGERNVPLGKLPVGDTLARLTQLDGGVGTPPALLGAKHILCWGYDDMINAAGGGNDKDESKPKDKDPEPCKRSLACDGRYLYTTNGIGCGLSKIGTGLCGTLRGYVYAKNLALPPGFVAWAKGVLLHRPYDFDLREGEGESTVLANVVDPLTLQRIGRVVEAPGEEILRMDAPHCTVQLCSDGMCFHLIRCCTTVVDKGAKNALLPVYLDSFQVIKGEEWQARSTKNRVILTRKDDGIQPKGSGESLLSRLRPYRSATSTLVALTGSTGGGGPSSSSGSSNNNNNNSQEPASATSCGLSFKSLVNSPILICGTYVTILTTAPGQSGGAAARTLFGVSGGMCASSRTLLSNFSFYAQDGQFHGRCDLLDAPGCALARGAAQQQIGTAYDPANNFIWVASGDWVDQFHNPGHQVPAYVRARLGIRDENVSEGAIDVAEVCSVLLRHVGLSSCHQMALESSRDVQLVDTSHFVHVLDILEHAIQHSKWVECRCILVLVQATFKTTVFGANSSELISRLKVLLWKLIEGECDTECAELSEAFGILMGTKAEACRCISAGLGVLYPGVQDQAWLLQRLVGGKESGTVTYLRDLVLIDYSDRLALTAPASEIPTDVPDDLLHFLFKVAVKEACMTITDCGQLSWNELEQALALQPAASVCVRYLRSVQCRMLARPLAEDISEQYHHVVSAFVAHVFESAFEVLEELLKVSHMVMNGPESEQRLQALEQVSRSTLLGYLLPTTLTSMTHPRLQCLATSEQLMPQLVQLVILTSQASLVLKMQQTEAPEQGSKITTTEEEEPGFLSGLKIPAPWSTGKTVESIHPVRDNYKFKETVQIPGARCLYLRFDPRCSSQYDYDKLVVYAGPNAGSTKAAEYGGNTMGFGSRSVLGAGWPKDLVRVDGDTVTFSFEMRSGREHNTPDRAMWGFLVTVRAQESAEEVSVGLPFLADLALGLSVLACCMLHILYEGPHISSEEEACGHLLQSKLLQRCEWQSGGAHSNQPTAIRENGEASKSPSRPASPILPRIKLLAEQLRHLRDMTSSQPPKIRASIAQMLQAEALEESVIYAILKHFSLLDVVRDLSQHQDRGTPEYFLLVDVVTEAYRKLDALVRRLQFLAELECKWKDEVLDIQQGTSKPSSSFFADYHLSDTKLQELSLLCYLKDVQFNPLNMEAAVNELSERLKNEADNTKWVEDNESPGKSAAMGKTRTLVQGILERAELLATVTISIKFVNQSQSLMTMTRSCSGWPGNEGKSHGGVSHRFSLPVELEGSADDSILQIPWMKRKRLHRKWQGCDSILQDMMGAESQASGTEKPHGPLLAQLFSFIGSHPEKAVSCQSFLNCAKVRYRRGETRKQALVHMKELLMAASRVGGGTHLVAAVTSVLQKGPRIEELTCGGMTDKVREAFVETMTSVVQLASRYPLACRNSIGLLCVIPYSRSEEKCLVRSGLVNLLDRLCSQWGVKSRSGEISRGQTAGTSGNNPAAAKAHQLSLLAWAGFQVLANRCVQWEEDGEELPPSTSPDNLESSGLARQVSQLLSNYLARATNCPGDEAAGNEALQEVLGLLNSLAKSRMGKAILSQPACVSKLLSLLLDPRLSPKLVLVLLQLCQVALPLMAAQECAQVELPQWTVGNEMYKPDADDPAASIAALLLAKLADYLVPGCQTTVSPQSSVDKCVASSSEVQAISTDPGMSLARASSSDLKPPLGKLSIYLHKREDQNAREILQQLLNASAEMRLLRFGRGTNLENLDREMTKKNKAEIITEDSTTALKRATKLAQSGLVVSVGPPQEGGSSHVDQADKKKSTDIICKERNVELAKSDPVRPFISGQVSNSMAAEVIALIHSLLGPNSAQVWQKAVERVLSAAVGHLSHLARATEHLSALSSSPSTSSGTSTCQYDLVHSFNMGRKAVATLAALGGFREKVKPGVEVSITGPGIQDCRGTVLGITEPTGMVTLRMCAPEEGMAGHPSEITSVPLSRLVPAKNRFQISNCLSLSEQIIDGIQNLLLPENNGRCPLQTALPAQGDGNTLLMAFSRLCAEIRTRACMVLSAYLQQPTFASLFLQNCERGVEILKSLSKECLPSDRSSMVESQCDRIRQLYRDCIKPQPPPSKIGGRSKEMTWDPTRPFPPVRACLFCQGLAGITFLGDPAVGSGLPRGTLVYATLPIPQTAPSFYWEVEILSFGDTQDESGPVISVGFAPHAERKDGAWTSPVGTVFFHNNGRVVHYNGSSLLQWKSIRLDVQLNPGDVAGIGWERTSEPHSTPVWGQVFFSHNGIRQPSVLEEVHGGMWPVVHIQKKNTSVRANFGGRPFAYAEGQMHQRAALEASDSSQDICATFGLLPFHGSDSESEISAGGSMALSSSTSDADFQMGLRSPTGQPCRIATTPKPNKEYNPDASASYKLNVSNDMCSCTGTISGGVGGVGGGSASSVESDLSDLEESGEADGSGSGSASEDLHSLLVKAWESKVFPIIRRRFRNEAERRDGLEQIRGALQLGMTDIARQTVEFLYEENGGIPGDLRLPTIEDIKEEASRFTIDKVKKGAAVYIRNAQSGMALPKFAISSMLKTCGLIGEVLEVDTQHELVQVETYLRSEGVLVRYWYPLHVLEKPPQGVRKTAVTGAQILDTNNIQIHRELLNWEYALSRMYCRTALLELIEQCNSPDCLPAVGFGSAVAASAALLQDLDVENLQLLSNEYLAAAAPGGNVLDTNLTTADSSDGCLRTWSGLASDLFYKSKGKLQKELQSAIVRAAKQGEDYVIELSNQICVPLQLAPEGFHVEEVSVSESKLKTDIHLPGASFTVVSVKIEPGPGRKKDADGRPAAVRLYTYDGHHVKKNGQISRQEVISYPLDCRGMSSSSHNFFPTVIMAADKVHMRVLDTNWPGMVVCFHGIPSQLPLALIYIEEILSLAAKQMASGDVLENKESQLLITTGILLHAVELLCGYMWRTDIPHVIKEPLFLLLAELLRTVQNYHHEEELLLPHLALMLQLQMEVKRLYEEESREQPQGAPLTTSSASSHSSGSSGFISGGSECWRFSTYLQALLEVAMVIAEVTSPLVAAPLALCPSSPSLVGSTSSSEKEGSPLVAPPSPSGPSRRKIKLPARRDREGRSMRSRSGSNSPRNSTVTVVVQSSSSTATILTTTTTTTTTTESPDSSTSLTSKAEDLLWFHRALTLSQILRYVTFSDRKGAQVTADAVSDAAQSLCIPKAHSRLLVVTGIPTRLTCQQVHWGITKALRGAGGLFKEEAFVPEATSGGGIQGWAVVEVRARTKVEQARKALYKSKALRGHGEAAERGSSRAEGENDPSEEVIGVSTVSSCLQATDAEANGPLEMYLASKLFSDPASDKLCESALCGLTDIYHSCFIADQHLHLGSESPREESGFIHLSRAQILAQIQGNLLHSYFSSTKQQRKSVSEQVTTVLSQYGFAKVEDKHEGKESSENKEKPQKQAKKRPSKEQQVAMDESAPEKSQVHDQGKSTPEDSSTAVGTSATKSESKEGSPEYEEKYLTLDGFLQCVCDMAKQDIRVVWTGFFACGFDLHLDRCSVLDMNHAQHMCDEWTVEKDGALVSYVNCLCQHLGILPSRLHPHEVYLTQAQLASAEYSVLQGIPIESVRLRFAFLQSLNNSLETFFLPLMDLKVNPLHTQSTAALLSAARNLIFYDCKVSLINRFINATAKRGHDQASPEIVLDPLEVIGRVQEDVQSTQFCQAMSQLQDVPSGMLCVPLASGGDPTYPFNVRLTGEEVQGTSGSFRHFLSQATRELQGPLLSLLVLCPSAASGKHRGRYLLKPGPLTFGEERMLQFLGQLLGITARADIPLPLDLLPVTWKAVLGMPLDVAEDLKEADTVTYAYLKELSMVENKADLEQLLAEHQWPRFVFSTLSGEQVELCPGGSGIQVSWENRLEYVDAVRELRMRELRSEERVSAIKAGMASVIPFASLATLTSPADVEQRLCGMPEVDLDFLKAHTLYQVGILETDAHIEQFWAALESFSQDELRRFVKFACNQDRIPMSCPCKDGTADAVHVPPYPMKIAPPDTRPGNPNERHIRVETCLFMIQLPQYSSLEVMTERLLYAIHCRDDPLSG